MSIFFLKAGLVCQVSFVYIIVTNYVNWHRENLRLDRENTGNLRIQFEWVPCKRYGKLMIGVEGINHGMIKAGLSQRPYIIEMMHSYTLPM